MLGLIGKKLGMTQVFDENGQVLPVTVIEAGPCTVMQIKKVETDGYNALQLGFNEIKESRAVKPLLGHAKKAGAAPMARLKEFKVDTLDEFEVGMVLKVDRFSDGDKIKVTGSSKGKGFQGVVKRWGFSGGDETHGTKSKRVPGSIGAASDPARVWKGTKLPGRTGGKQVTARTLTVVKVDGERNLLLVKGSVPGHMNGYVFVEKL